MIMDVFVDTYIDNQELFLERAKECVLEKGLDIKYKDLIQNIIESFNYMLRDYFGLN